MTKPPARVPTPSILLTLLSLGIMPRPSLRVACWEDGQYESV